MKRSILFAILLYTNIAVGQQLSKSYVDNWLHEVDSTINIDANTAYFIDLAVFIPAIGGFSVDSALGTISSKDLLNIEFYRPLNDTTINFLFYRPKNSLNIFIYTKKTQSSFLINSIYKKAVSLFKENSSSPDKLPALAINDNLI